MAGKAPVPRAKWDTPAQQRSMDAMVSTLQRIVDEQAVFISSSQSSGSQTVIIGEGDTGGGTPDPSQPVEYPDKVTGFTVEGAYTSVIISWDRPAYSGHAHTAIYRNTVDNFETASVATETVATSFADPIGPDAEFFYWARNVNTDGTEGPPNDASGTKGCTYKGSNEEAEYIDYLIAQKVTADYISAMELSGVRLFTTSINVDQYNNPTSNMFWIKASGQMYAEGSTMKNLTVLDQNGDISMQSGRTLWSAVDGSGKPADGADVTNYSDNRVANSKLTEAQVRATGYAPRDYEVTTYIDVAMMNALFVGEIFVGRIYAENIEGDVYEEYYFDNNGVGWTSPDDAISNKERLVRFTIPAVSWPRRFIHKATSGWYDFDGSSTESCYIGVYLVVNNVYTRLASWSQSDDNDTYTVTINEAIGPVIPAGSTAYVDYVRYAGSDGAGHLHLGYMRFAMYKDTGVSDITDTLYYYGEYDSRY